ncbi:MAG: hypothetical protein ACOYNS_08475 [Bacteroidota bacterium]
MTVTIQQHIARTGRYAAIGSAALLMALHAFSPEFDPTWRMISEYAYGNYGILLTLFFLLWGISEWCAVAALSQVVSGGWSKLALVLLFVSGIGAFMGGLFDVRHPLHGAAFGIGVPFIPISALILSYHLVRRNSSLDRSIVWSAHTTWLSLIAMAVSMAMFITGLKAAGAFHPEAPPQMLQMLPAGVPAVTGIPNRLLVLAYISWTYLANRAAEKLAETK